ncbi:MAG: pyruvate ferredoxin oxidoreductase [Bacteroidales bacterium]|nr:pyruvate ferredoxin oxidoreductase [Bacteroidales bacterium]
MKDYKYIEELLESYFRAETSLQEEQILNAFFQDDNQVPKHLKAYRALFAVEEVMRRECAPQASQESFGQQPARRVNLRPFYRAAASVAIVLCLGMAASMSMGVTGDDKAPTAEAVENPDAEFGEMEQSLTPQSSAVVEKKDTLFLY